LSQGDLRAIASAPQPICKILELRAQSGQLRDARFYRRVKSPTRRPRDAQRRGRTRLQTRARCWPRSQEALLARQPCAPLAI